MPYSARRAASCTTTLLLSLTACSLLPRARADDLDTDTDNDAPPLPTTWSVSTNVRFSPISPLVEEALRNGSLTFKGDLLRYSDIDAHIHCVCPVLDRVSDTASACGPGCVWELSAATRILNPEGYTGFRTWRTVNGGGHLDKRRIASVDLEWIDPVCRWPSPSSASSSSTCDLSSLPLTENNTDKTVKAVVREEWREGDGDAPLLHCWQDVSRVPHCMKPSLHQTLRQLDTFPLSEGRDMSITQIWASSKAAVIVFFLFLLVLFIIIAVSCRRSRSFNKKQDLYLLNTEGLNTNMMVEERLALHTEDEVRSMSRDQMQSAALRRIEMNPSLRSEDINSKRIDEMEIEKLRNELVEGNLSSAQVKDRNKLQWKHAGFIAIVLFWRIARMIVFTISFMIFLFQWVSHAHFDTLSQHNAYRLNLTDQVISLAREIEDTYDAEMVRQADQYTWQRDQCSQSTVRIEAEYAQSEAQVRLYHDEQMAARQRNTQYTDVEFSRLSSTHACSAITSATPNALGCSVGANGTQTCIPYSRYSTTDWYQVLNNECSRRRADPNASLTCEGFGLDTTQSKYYLYESLPQPYVSFINLGYCYGWVSQLVRNEVDYSEYRSQINSTLQMANQILNSLSASTDPVQITMDYAATSYGFQRITSASYFADPNGGAGDWFVRGTYGCPNCPGEFVEPSWPFMSSTQYNHSNNTYDVEDAAANFSIGVDADLIRQIRGQYEEAYFPDLVEFPTVDIDVWQLAIPPNLFAMVLMIDMVMVFYRVMVLVFILTRYMRGSEKIIPLTLLGREYDIDWAKKMAGGCFHGCIRRIHRGLTRMDTVMWLIIGKLLFLFHVVLFGCIVLAAYWFVDNLIDVHVFEELNLFSSLVAAPAAQRIIRNEQIALGGYSRNTILLTETELAFKAKGFELSNRARTFNAREIERVKAFNAQDCETRNSRLQDQHNMQVCLFNTSSSFTSPSSSSSSAASLSPSSSCGVSAEVQGLQNGGWFDFELSNPSALNVAEDTNNHIVDQLSMTWRWTPPSGTAEWEETRTLTRCASPVVQGSTGNDQRIMVDSVTCLGSGCDTDATQLVQAASNSMSAAASPARVASDALTCGTSCDASNWVDGNNNGNAMVQAIIVEPSACACQQTCVSTSGCAAFVFDRQTGNCWLKSTMGSAFIGGGCTSGQCTTTTVLATGAYAMDASAIKQANSATPQLEALAFRVELLALNDTGSSGVADGEQNYYTTSTFNVTAELRLAIDGAVCSQMPPCDPVQDPVGCDSTVPTSGYYLGVHRCVMDGGTSYSITLDAAELQSQIESSSSTNGLPTAKRVRVSVLPSSATSSRYFSLENVQVLAHQDTSQWTCNEEVEWRKLEYQPSTTVLGNCSELLPIHGHMMRTFSSDEWTQVIREGYVPFIQAMRNICLAPFYIVTVVIIVFLIIEMFLMVVEVALVKANLVRQNVFARVPCTIASKVYEKNIQLAKKPSHLRGTEMSKSASSPAWANGNTRTTSAFLEVPGRSSSHVGPTQPTPAPAPARGPSSTVHPFQRSATTSTGLDIGDDTLRNMRDSEVKQMVGQMHKEVKQLPIPPSRPAPVARSPAQSNWQAHTDESSGRHYWHNLVTNETTWTCPMEHKAHAAKHRNDIPNTEL